MISQASDDRDRHPLYNAVLMISAWKCRNCSHYFPILIGSLAGAVPRSTVRITKAVPLYTTYLVIELLLISLSPPRRGVLRRRSQRPVLLAKMQPGRLGLRVVLLGWHWTRHLAVPGPVAPS